MGLVSSRHVRSSRIRDQTCVSCIAKRILNHWSPSEAWPLFEQLPGSGPAWWYLEEDPPCQSDLVGMGWAGCWGKAFIGGIWGFPDDSVGQESTCDVRRDAGDSGSIPGLGRSPGQGNGNPFYYSCLKNPMDRGAWWATVEKVAKSWTCLSN